MGALHAALEGGMAVDESGWALQLAVLDQLAKIWREPDQGIWEVRDEARQFTYSKVMAWVAFDRAIKSAEQFKLKGPVERWRASAAEIHREICERGFNREIGSFVRAFGSKEMDASLLLLPSVGFLPPRDPRIRDNVAAVERLV